MQQPDTSQSLLPGDGDESMQSMPIRIRTRALSSKTSAIQSGEQQKQKSASKRVLITVMGQNRQATNARAREPEASSVTAVGLLPRLNSGCRRWRIIKYKP